MRQLFFVFVLPSKQHKAFRKNFAHIYFVKLLLKIIKQSNHFRITPLLNVSKQKTLKMIFLNDKNQILKIFLIEKFKNDLQQQSL